MTLHGKWEERWHPLREEWVIVAAHRQNRPWIGETVERKADPVPSYLPDCYLCPRNKRVSGAENAPYLLALVASSWNISDSVTASLAGRNSRSPFSVNRTWP